MTRKATRKEDAMPVEVEILTKDYEVRGLIYVARDADENRRISDLLNDQDKRFLAVTDAQLVNRGAPGTPRHYTFLQIHMDNILMLHPSSQSMARQVAYGEEEAARLQKMRGKLRQG